MKLKANRDINIDILRIICMAMVVLTHTFNNGGAQQIRDLLIPGSANWFVGVSVFSPCLVAVNTFVLITGYYSCKHNMRLAKIAQIWIETVFYSVVLYLIACQMQGGYISLKEICKRILCVTQERYWFISCYLMLLILSPVLNIIIEKCTHRELFKICLILIAALSIFPNVPLYSYDIFNVNRGFSIIWFCALYIFADYIRKWLYRGKYSKQFWLFLYVVSCMIMAGSSLLPYYFPWLIYAGTYTTHNSITCLAGAVSLFCFFRELNFKQLLLKELAGVLAPLSLAVFLIHHNQDIRDYLWQTINAVALQSSIWLIPYLLLSACGIIGICFVIDYIRLMIFRLVHINEFTQKLLDKTQNSIFKYTAKMYKKLTIREQIVERNTNPSKE